MVVRQFGVEHGAHGERRVGVGVVLDDVDAVRAGARRALVVDEDLAGVAVDGDRADDVDLAAVGEVEHRRWRGTCRPGSSRMLARVAASERAMISSARSSMSSRPWRSHSDCSRCAPTSPLAICACRSPAMWSGWRTLRQDELPHVGVALAGDHQPQIGIQMPFLEHVAGAGADAVAADVGVVDRRAEEGDDATVAEHRVQHGDVEQLAGRLVRVVGDQHVALDQRVGRVLVEDRRRGAGERVDVAGRAGDRLGDHAAATVEHRVGEVAGLAHDRRERGALQRPGLLVDRGDQALPQHLELDRVEGSGHRAAPVLSATSDPSAATLAVQPGRMTAVVSRSSTIAGPTICWPRPRSGRR